MTEIAKKALAIANKRDAERLEFLKRLALSDITEGFDHLLMESTYFEGEHSFNFDNAYDHGSDDEIIAICESQGYTAKKDPNRKHAYILSASVITEEQVETATVAQKRILRHNEEVRRRRKYIESTAKKLCQEIAKKIENEDFISNKKKNVPNTYEIKVENSGYANCNDVLIDMAKKLLEEMGFHNIVTSDSGSSWTFDVYDEG